MSVKRDDRLLGFIPAKGSSTRFPRKNLAPLQGRPLLWWAINSAQQSGVLDKVAVSSEDEEILQYSTDHGVDFALRRPEALARDPVGIVDVALFALNQLMDQGQHFGVIVILAPTCPLRSATDITECVSLFDSVRPRAVMSVSEFTHTPFATLILDEGGCLVPAFPDYFGRKSQDMPRAFRPNGAVHVLDVARFREMRSYSAPPLVPYIMPRARSIDIDHQSDLDEANSILNQEKQSR